MKTILKMCLVVSLLIILSPSLRTSTNDWKGVPDKLRIKIHVLASNYRVRGKEIKVKDKKIKEDEEEISSLKTQRTLGFIGTIIAVILAIIS